MKLPDFTDFTPLIGLRREMGATELGALRVSFPNREASDAEVAELNSRGIELEDLADLKVLDDGTLAYKGIRVLLHIRDPRGYHNSLPKAHVSDCTTLQEWRGVNSLARYVVASRDDGQFIVLRKDTKGNKTESLVRLDVCKNCLKHLNFDRYADATTGEQRSGIFKQFTFARFFEMYPKDLLHTEGMSSDIAARVDKYPSDWDDISDRVRADSNWTCKDCGVYLGKSSHNRFLQTHHKNLIRSDCSEHNLVALCIQCHANQPHHSHMRSLPQIAELRDLKRTGQVSIKKKLLRRR